MASLILYILLGFVQGIIEWLPVSSEGQLVLLALWLEDISEETALKLAFWLHIGTMIAVLVFYRFEWLHIVDLRAEDTTNVRSFIVISTIGTAFVGVPINLFLIDTINTKSISLIIMWIIGLSLIITGVLIHISRKRGGKRNLHNLSKLEIFIVGCAQGFAIIPGISRSGITVSTLLLLNVDSKESFRGSFLMSVPAVLGAIGLDILVSLWKKESLFGELNKFGLLVGISIAFVIGLMSMQTLIFVAQKYNFSLIAISTGIFIIILLNIIEYM